MLYLYVKSAIRNLLKTNAYSILIVGGFAIGFATCILIGLFYHTETTVNENFEHHKQIYRLYDVKQNRCNLNWDLFPVLTSGYAAVEDACPLDYQDRELLTLRDETTLNNTEIKYLLATTSNFFSIFSVEILESLSGKPFDGKESVAISGPAAKLIFGTQDPLGQQISIGNHFYGRITSVFKELPVNSSFKADIILNSENEKFRFSSTMSNGEKYNPSNLFVMIKEGTVTGDFTDELNRSAILGSLDVDSIALQSLDDIYLSELTIKSRHSKGNPVLLKIFLAIAALILFLSSINYLNYSVSMQYARLKNSGIKLTFGAGLKNLVSQTLVEVSIGILISLAFAMIMVDMSLSYAESIFGKELQVTLKDILAVAPVFLAILIFIILFNSLAPIYILSKFNISEFMSGFRADRNRKQLWKKALLTFQLTVSIALISVVLTIFRQLDYVKHSGTGFNSELLLRINIPYRFRQTEALKQELEKLSFVKNTTLSSGCPGMINHKYGSNTGDKSIDINTIYVGGDYLNTMGIELLEGRDFLDGDLNKACLLNEEALKQLGWENFEGERCSIGQEGGYEVIGVIKDFKFESYHFAVEPLALLLTGAEDGNVLSVRFTPGNTANQIDQLSRIWYSFSPHDPFSFVFYDDSFQSMYEKEEKLASSITFFSLVAIALTCMGILGQIFMICLTRIKEIGIRKIHGAKVSEVLFLLNYDFIKLITVAFFVATPVSWFITHKWLRNFAYKTSLSWWIFLLAGALALFITMVTVSWQSWRAARRNPVEALRYE